MQGSHSSSSPTNSLGRLRSRYCRLDNIGNTNRRFTSSCLGIGIAIVLCRNWGIVGQRCRSRWISSTFVYLKFFCTASGLPCFYLRLKLSYCSRARGDFIIISFWSCCTYPKRDNCFWTDTLTCMLNSIVIGQSRIKSCCIGLLIITIAILQIDLSRAISYSCT